jgi:cyanophycinase
LPSRHNDFVTRPPLSFIPQNPFLDQRTLPPTDFIIMPMPTRPIRTLPALLLIFALALSACTSSSEDAPEPEPSPAVPNGTLMLAGGAAEAELHAEFVRLAGGADANIVYVPTAGQSVDIEETRAYVRQQAPKIGASPENMVVLHTRDSLVADTDSFAAALDTADAVWFSGGRQWRLVDAYSETKTLDGFWSVLERGGVIGGSSAGATIQGSFLVRGDTETNTIMMGNHRKGFGFLPQSAVDQHLLARDRQYDLIPVIEAHPELLGIGLDENTAIVVRGDTARVVGESLVAIYDHRRWSAADSTLDRDDKFFFLEPGDRFDLRTRTALPPSE